MKFRGIIRIATKLSVLLSEIPAAFVSIYFGSVFQALLAGEQGTNGGDHDFFEYFCFRNREGEIVKNFHIVGKSFQLQKIYQKLG